MSSTAAANLAGTWFGGLASALLQGRWHEAAASHGAEQQPRRRQQQQKLGGGLGERKEEAAAEDVGRCGGAMSDTTLCLLLDRFAPS